MKSFSAIDIDNIVLTRSDQPTDVTESPSTERSHSRVTLGVGQNGVKEHLLLSSYTVNCLTD